ncbi:MAG: excinuclease ABC subunit UvrC [Phycisphaerae bacterium]|nr:excinuclease ABC subunit UvrC [Phycisphaerae bacterium]
MPDEHPARLASLLLKARELPATPGVYLMKDAAGVVLYVGKAARLPDRVSSYFTPAADLGPRKQPMLDAVCDFDVIECESEWEAVLTENRLIKDIKPRFNALQRDDKTFPYLAVTLRDEFPRVLVTRAPADPALRGAKILGPFVSPGALRQSLALFQRVFKFRTCELEIRAEDPRNRVFRPCLLHAIGQCTAPCAGRIGRDAYRADIDRLCRFLESRQSSMLAEMRAEMTRASSDLRFEQAAVLRDQILAIEGLSKRARRGDHWQRESEFVPRADPARATRTLARVLGADRPVRCIEGFDIAHLQGNETVASKVCFVDGRPFKDEYRRYRIATAGNDDFASMREVVSRRYRDAAHGQELFPDLVLIDGGPAQLSAARDAFASLDARPPLVASLAKREELIFVLGRDEPIRLGRDNAALRLLQSVRDEAHRFAQKYHHVLRRKRTMGE